MRIRYLKPGFFTNEALAELRPEARLLYAGLWLLADREGRLEDRPKRIKAEIFPYDSYDVEKLLSSLASNGFLVRYQVDGQNYIWLPSFKKHQRINPRELPSALPRCDQEAAESVPEHTLDDAEAQPENFQMDHQRERGRERGRELEREREQDGDSVPGHSITASDGPLTNEQHDVLLTIEQCLPRGKVDNGVHFELQQVVEDWEPQLVLTALRDCQRTRSQPWPSELRKRLPMLGTAPVVAQKPNPNGITEDDPRYRGPKLADLLGGQQ